MRTIEKRRAGFAPVVFARGFFAGVAVFALLAAGCLNPISFNPDDLPALKVTGEISIDNINSAELNFRNHTRSVDVVKVDIIQHRLEKTYGSGSTPVERLDARISGAPTAGTQDSVLVRPTGTNVTSDITVEKYTIKVWYEKAQDFPSDLDAADFTDLQNTNPDDPLTVELDELPRGRCVFHIYRHQDGTIQIDVDGVADDPNYSDYHNDDDFIVDVRSQTNVDLSGLELTVNLSPVEVTFSPELIAAVNAAFGSLAGSVDKIATSVNDLALSVDSYRLFGKNTGQLVVLNWSPKPVTVHIPVDSHTKLIGPVSPGDLDGMLLSTANGGKYNLKVFSGSDEITTRNTFVYNQKVTYLHVYVNQSGSVVSDVTDSSNRPADAEIGSGRLRVKNLTTSAITNIVFLKKIGIGNGADYDTSKSFSVQKVGPGAETQYSSVMSDKVEAGNYSVFCTLEDGRVVFEGLDFYILPDEVAYQTGDNVIEIHQDQIKPPSSTIMYNVIADGGPPIEVTSEYYSTTKLTIIFTSPVANLLFQKTSMSSAIGSVNPVSDYVWEVEITNPQTEIAKFKLAGQDIDDSEHQVQIYRQSDGAVAFVPVTDVIILNGESFTKGVSKQLQWKVIPENATNQTFPLDETVGATQGWTAGAVDVLVNDYEVKQKGLIKVESSSGYETFNVGVIIPNGLAVGKREVSFHIVPGGVLQYDAGKDFVKVFTLTSPDTTPPPPSSPVDNNSTNVVLNYVGRGAGGKDQWSVNLIEVYTRPKKLYKSDSTFYKDVTNTGGGVLTYGDPVTGKTGVHWQANPMDELSAYWGGTSEGWIDGTEKPDGTTLGPDENTLQFFTYPAVLGTENTAIALKDRQNMAFAYYNDGTYRTYRKNFRGETRENFLGSIRLDGTVTGTLTGEWVKKVSVDDKFNATGEQFNLALPTDQGPLWLRLRMDYNDGTVGYWWKAVYLQEWFVFHPDMLSSYATDANGNVIIDVDLYATPYMTYRTK